MCSDPFGVHERGHELVSSNEVDHIIPRVRDVSLSLTLSNLQGLCKRCHSRKTRKETYGG